MPQVFFKSRQADSGSSIIIASRENKKPVDIMVNSERVEGLLSLAENSEFTEVTMYSGERFIIPHYSIEEVAQKLGYALN